MVIAPFAVVHGLFHLMTVFRFHRAPLRAAVANDDWEFGSSVFMSFCTRGEKGITIFHLDLSNHRGRRDWLQFDIQSSNIKSRSWGLSNPYHVTVILLFLELFTDAELYNQSLTGGWCSAMVLNRGDALLDIATQIITFSWSSNRFSELYSGCCCNCCGL